MSLRARLTVTGTRIDGIGAESIGTKCKDESMPGSRKNPWSVLPGATIAILVSALLSAAATPGVGSFPLLAWIAFAPWLASLRWLASLPAALSGLVLGLAYIIPGKWDIFSTAIAAKGETGWEQHALTVGFFLCYALPFALFGALDAASRGLRLRLPGAFVPALRAGVLASLICALWSPFGYTPVTAVVDYTAWLQPAELGGEPLILMLLLWTSTALAAAFALGSWRDRLATLAPALIAVSIAGGYGAWRLQQLDLRETTAADARLRVLPLQLDLPMFAAPSTLLRDRPAGRMSALELSRRAIEASPECELVVWPEVPVRVEDSDALCARGSDIAASLGPPLLMQCYRRSHERLMVTAEWFRPEMKRHQWHGKSSLVPFYEKPLWGEAEFIEGEPGEVFALDDRRRLIPALCYEVHAAEHLRRASLDGGNVVVHMASFTPFGGPAIDALDVAMGRLQAIEYRLPIVRSANRGTAGWIDVAGRVRSGGEGRGRRAECVDVWLPSLPPTPFARLGPLAPWLPAAVMLLIAGLLHGWTRFRLRRRRA